MRVRSQALHRLGAVCLCVLIAAPPAAAQTLPPQLPPGPLTLAQVLEIAEARSEAVAIARAGIDRADANRVRARSGKLPQLSASASYDRALASEFEGIFDSTSFPPVEGGDGATDLQDLPFGRVNTWRVGLTLSQTLYSGGRIQAQEAVASAGRESADLSLRGARGQLLFEASQAYFDAALGARLVEIAQATLTQAEATLKQVQAGFSAGTQPEFEVLRARVNRDNERPQVIRQLANRETALLRLKQLLDLPPAYDLQLAESFGDRSLDSPAPFGARVAAVESVLESSGLEAIIERGLGLPLPERAVVDAAASDLQRSQAALKAAEAERMPSVTLNSTYGRVGYPSGVVWGFGGLRTNWTLGASVQVPILTGGRQRGDEMAARADVEESRQRFQQVQQLADLDTRLAWAELVAARATWEASAGTVEQAARAYEIAEVRYRAGVSTQLELSDSRLQLQQAEATRAIAARDVQVARARVALLPELPISTGAPVNSGGAPTAPQPQPQTPVQPRSGAGAIQAASLQAVPGTAGR